MKTLIMGVLLSTVLSGCQSMPTMPVARAAVAAPLGPRWRWATYGAGPEGYSYNAATSVAFGL
jgi:hypothetical protein